MTSSGALPLLKTTTMLELHNSRNNNSDGSTLETQENTKESLRDVDYAEQPHIKDL